jgi:hypothetical protein
VLQANESALVASYQYEHPEFVPDPGDNRVHINLWLQNGDRPKWGRRVHSIIAGFEYSATDHAFPNLPGNKGTRPARLLAETGPIGVNSAGDRTGAGARITMETLYSKKSATPYKDAIKNSFHNLASKFGADFEQVKAAPQAFLHLSFPTFLAITLGTVLGMLAMFVVGIAAAKRYIRIPFVESAWNMFEERVGVRKPLPGSAAHSQSSVQPRLSSQEVQ